MRSANTAASHCLTFIGHQRGWQLGVDGVDGRRASIGVAARRGQAARETAAPLIRTSTIAFDVHACAPAASYGELQRRAPAIRPAAHGAYDRVALVPVCALLARAAYPRLQQFCVQRPRRMQMRACLRWLNAGRCAPTGYEGSSPLAIGASGEAEAMPLPQCELTGRAFSAEGEGAPHVLPCSHVYSLLGIQQVRGRPRAKSVRLGESARWDAGLACAEHTRRPETATGRHEEIHDAGSASWARPGLAGRPWRVVRKLAAAGASASRHAFGGRLPARYRNYYQIFLF